MEENIIQDIPILTDEEIEPLKQIRILSTRGKAPNTYTTQQDLYTANDTEFMNWLEVITKIKKEKIMAELGDDGSTDEGGGWNNANRLRRRLQFLETYKEAIEKSERFNPLIRLEFTVKDGKKTKKRNCYNATDKEFMWFVSRATKTKEEKLLTGVDMSQGWTDDNRYEIRLSFIKRFRKSLSSFQQTIDKK